MPRFDRDPDGRALVLPDIAPMCSAGRRMQGCLRAGPPAYGDDALRWRLRDATLAFVGTLPSR